MQYLVTGASGFVGKDLVQTLAREGYNGLAISRREITSLPCGWLWRGRLAVLQSGLQPANQQANPVEVARPDNEALIHLEVKQHVTNPAPGDIDQLRAVNIGGTRNWLDWCTRNGVRRFVYFSTVKAVGGAVQGKSTVPLDEGAAGPGDTAYGASKWAAELAVRDWAEEDSRRCALVLRPAVVYGPGNSANIYSFINTLYQGRFFLVGRNDNVKSMVSIRNLCQAVAFLLPRMRPGLEIYNITDEQSYSVRELASMIARLLKVRWSGRSIPLPLARVGAAIGTMVNSVTHKEVPLTGQRLEALLETTHFSCAKLLGSGFKHPETTDEGLASMVKWYRGLANMNDEDCDFATPSSGKVVTDA